jgi:L-fucono-1,5-lactonase
MEMKNLIIDSHQHFWLNPKKTEYIWMGPEHEPIVRDYMPVDLEPILLKHGIDQAITVQAAVTEIEAEFILRIAESHDFIAGSVIWLDMDSSDFESRLEYFRFHPKFLGIRPMIGALKDDDWMLKKPVRKAFQLVLEKEVCFDFAIYPRHFKNVLKIIDTFQGIRAVIDHIGNPDIKKGDFQQWAEYMEQIASHPNIFCKLSGMVSRAEWFAWKPDDFRPYVQHLLKIFGPSRLMFGSDWPPCLLAANSYGDIVDALKKNLSDISAADLECIFGGSAVRFYRLK